MLLSYKIDKKVIDPVPGMTMQNLNQSDVISVSVSLTLQIAAGGDAGYITNITLYTLNENK
jgi:hypothetical protein